MLEPTDWKYQAGTDGNGCGQATPMAAAIQSCKLEDSAPICTHGLEALGAQRLRELSLQFAAVVPRRSGYVQIDLLHRCTAWETNWQLGKLMARHPDCYHTITSDNGCDFHSYREVEASSDVRFYSAPHHS